MCVCVCVCVCVPLCESSGRKEITCYLIYHELLSLRLAGYITDANTEQRPSPGKVVPRNYAVTQSYLLPLHLGGTCMTTAYKSTQKLLHFCPQIVGMQRRDVLVLRDF